MQNNMKYLICNLKANKLQKECIEYENEINKIEFDNLIELIICPSTPYLYLFQGDKYKLGSQDISRFDLGAHTGENPAAQLETLNVKYALVGHSERRILFKEEESTIIAKIKKAYHSHIHPIYFVGETLEQKNKNKEIEIIYNQLVTIIDEIPDYKREKMIIVYEPVWAIGTGKMPTVAEITKRIEFIKQLLNDKYSLNLPILYGGSINEINIDSLLSIKKLDGFVLGESAQEIPDLVSIYKKIQKNINKLDKN